MLLKMGEVGTAINKGMIGSIRVEKGDEMLKLQGGELAEWLTSRTGKEVKTRIKDEREKSR